MTDQPIDPAATPEDEDAPEIAADDVGASAIAERVGRQAESPVIEPRDEPFQDADADAADDEEGLDGEGV